MPGFVSPFLLKLGDQKATPNQLQELKIEKIESELSLTTIDQDTNMEDFSIFIISDHKEEETSVELLKDGKYFYLQFSEHKIWIVDFNLVAKDEIFYDKDHNSDRFVYEAKFGRKQVSGDMMIELMPSEFSTDDHILTKSGALFSYNQDSGSWICGALETIV